MYIINMILLFFLDSNNSDINKKDYLKNWKKQNKEKIKQYSKQWRENNKEKIKQYHKKWMQNNKNKVSKYHKDYREKNKSKLRQQHKNYYQQNKEKFRYNEQSKLRDFKRYGTENYNKKSRIRQYDRRNYKPILLKLYKNKCQVKGCNESKNLEIHHLHYEGGIEACQLLCIKHHNKIHEG